MAEEYLYPEEIKRDSWAKYLKNQINQPERRDDVITIPQKTHRILNSSTMELSEYYVEGTIINE